MNPQPRHCFALILCLLAALTIPAVAAPVEFNELSLLVRARESEPSILSQVSERKLAQKLTTEQENKLKSQGARESLVKALRNSNVILSEAEASTYQAEREQRQKARQTTAVGRPDTSHPSAPAERVRVFNVVDGHAINLSFWGGPDCEIAFQSYRYAAEDRIQAVMIDPVRTVTEERTYLGAGRHYDRFTGDGYRSSRFTPYLGGLLKDDENFVHSHYLSISSARATRELPIDYQNPVQMPGLPYTLYRVYGAGRVALYFIRASAGSVTLAVVPANL